MVLKTSHRATWAVISQGTGLGLPICRVIVQKMGGSLVIDGDYTEGCRFVPTLPLVVKAD